MRKVLPAAFVALFLVQVFPAVSLAWRHARQLEAGQPVRLAVETRDPRDLFRGEYSTLAYEIGRPQGLPATPPPDCDLAARETCALGRDRPVYLRLAPDAEGVHRATEALFAPPTDGLFIAGRLRAGTLARMGAKLGAGLCERAACLSGQVVYGIERWYGPQGQPARLDRAARRDVVVEARVAPDGAALLDGIRVGGAPFGRTARLW